MEPKYHIIPVTQAHDEMPLKISSLLGNNNRPHQTLDRVTRVLVAEDEAQGARVVARRG